MDSTNVFNHPVPNSPVLNINSTNPFGFIQDKGNSDPPVQSKPALRFLIAFGDGGETLVHVFPPSQITGKYSRYCYRKDH